MKSRLLEKTIHKILLFIGLLVLVWSRFDPVDSLAWIFLSLPVILATIFFYLTYKHFRFTHIIYWLGFFWAIVILVAAKHTYNLNPLFEFFKSTFDLSRNHYDRFAHFLQGFIPVLMIKEFLLRKGYITENKATNMIVIGLVLAFSASWELLEYFVTILSGMPHHYTLGMQGDVWDTQNDMMWAIIGAYVSLKTIGPYHLRKVHEKMREESSIKNYNI